MTSLSMPVLDRRRAAAVALVALPTLLGLVLAAWNLGHKPLWYDETFEALMAMMPPFRFARFLATFETTGAFYHVLLWLWKLVGTSEAVLRLPSLVFAVASLPVVFAIARRRLTPVWSAAAVTLLALSGFWVHYAQEARPYALWMLMASLSTLALLRAVEMPGRSRWLVYGVATVLGVWSHLMMVFVVAGQVLALAVHPDVRRWWRPAAAAVLAAALAAVPIAVSIMLANQARWDWLPSPTLEALWAGMRTVAGSVGDLAALAWLAGLLVGAGVVLRAWLSDRRGAWPMVLVLTWAIVPFVGPWLASHVREMYTPRYLFGVLPAVVLVITFGVAALRPRPLAIAALAGLLVIGGIGVAHWHTREDRVDWRSATRVVVEGGTRQDGLAFFTIGTFDGGALYQYRYYLTQFESGDRPTIVRLPDDGTPLEQQVAAAIAGWPRLWAVIGAPGEPDTRRALAVVEREFALASEQPFEGLTVRLYVRAAP
ncbi:MAG TPA: glycosyltransferase family 39 protein [Candidatus Limnocylindrales bacterium]